MRKFAAILTSILFLAPLATFAGIQGTMLIEQISPAELGTWILTSESGSKWSSEDPKVSPKKFSLSIADVGLLTLKVTPPPGASAKILVYRGGDLMKTITSNQYSFTLYPNDTYRFFIQYAFDRLGSIGITSTPSNAKFRMKGPSGKLYIGTTPMSFTNLPAGRYSVQVEATKGCSTAKPQSTVIQPDVRTTLHLTMPCEQTTKKSKTKNDRPTKRDIMKQAEDQNNKRLRD